MHDFLTRGLAAAVIAAGSGCATGFDGGSAGSAAAADGQAGHSPTDSAAPVGDGARAAETAAVTADGSAEGGDAPTVETAVDAQPVEVAADVAKPKPATTGTLKDTGDFAPEFSKVVASTGNPVSKADLLGHWTVLWFYPVAQTSG